MALPLVAALGFSVLHMDRLVNRSQDAVHKAVEATRDSRILTGQINSLERYARQYLLLRDEALLEAYRNSHNDFQLTARKLYSLTHATSLGEQVDLLSRAETGLYQQIAGGRLDSDAQQEVADRFGDLAGQAEALVSGASRLIDQEVESMREVAAQAQNTLFALALTVVPLSLLSVGVFTTLIANPIRQVDHAIHRLGDGDFDTAIRVSGPQDLQLLGKRLDWLRERLRDLEQQKAKFLQHMSHELKTPLTAIRESAELLSEGVVGELNDHQREIAEILRTNTRSLQSLIEDLLNFGTSQRHIPALYLSEVDLKALVNEIAQNHKPTLLSKRITLHCHLQETRLLADRDKLGTVVDNLLSNAIKFTPVDGTITVLLEQDGYDARLEVTDSGPGIDPEERTRVFEPFFQGRNRATGYVKGSGLGLSIAREYVSAHQGTIAVLDHPGPGARLEVRLPLRPGRKDSS